MESLTSKLFISSYNSTGFGISAKNYIRTLLLFSDILCVQEHFLLDSKDKNYSNIDKLKIDLGEKHDMFIVPAHKDPNQVSKGRGKGGLLTLWNKSLTKYVSKVDSANFRIQGTKFSFPDAHLLVINANFPCDPRINNFDETEILSLLANIRSLIDEANCPNVLIAADMNADFVRNTSYTELILENLTDLGLNILWRNPDDDPNHKIEDIDFTYMCELLFKSIKEAGVIHCGENTSNHSAIYTKVSFDNLNLSTESAPSQIRVTWNKACESAKNNYKETVKTNLNRIRLPNCLSCSNLHCQVHDLEMEDYTLTVLEALENAGRDCLPKNGFGKNKKRNIIPGWTEFVKPYATESKFWHSLWLSQGKPLWGYVYDCMRTSKHAYKYAIRRLKRCNDRIQNEKYIAGLIGQGRNIFKEIRKSHGSSNTFSSRIDHVVGSANIAQHFAGTYSKLYNQVENGQELISLSDAINRNINDASLIEVDRINDEVIRKALNKLKPNKRDSIFNIVSDCLINGPDDLIPHSTNLFKIYFIHGSVPKILLMCSLYPLVKNKLGDTTSSDNYRAIAGRSLLLKLLDLVILILEGDKLGFSELQFAYKAASSTTVCSWAVTSVIDTFNRSGSPVYAATMDMSKAFDMVEWVHLFSELKMRNVSSIFLRLMLYIYCNQKCEVRWAGQCSDQFSVNNGVRQGAVSSAILFAVYIDKLLVRLKKSRMGCYIHSVFVGAFIFADDILLLSVNRSGLQALVNICQEFASERNLTFGTNDNPAKSKTKCIVFTKKKCSSDPAPIFLDGKALPWVNKISHLGCTLQSDNSMKLDMTHKRGQFISKANSLLQEFGSNCYDTLFKLIDTYALSCYGSYLWNLCSKEAEKFFNSWNVLVRNVLNVSRKTHRFLIEPLSDHLHLKTLLMARFISFHRGLIHSQKFTIRFLARLAERDHRTVSGRTLDYLVDKCKLGNISDLSPHVVKKSLNFQSVPPELDWQVSLAREILSIRCGDTIIDGFTNEEINFMLDYACVS